MGRLLFTIWASVLSGFALATEPLPECPGLSQLAERTSDPDNLPLSRLLDGNTRHSPTRETHPFVTNWAELTEGGLEYLVPAPKTYGVPSWKWDLAFGADIALFAGRTNLARGSFLAAFQNQLPNGMVPHMNFPAGGKDQALWKRPNSSTITQPPLTLLVGEYLKPEDARALYPAAKAEALWWLNHRLKDGLPFIIHPWESGRDAGRDNDSQLVRFVAGVPANLSLQTKNPGEKDPVWKTARFNLLLALQAQKPGDPPPFQLRTPDMAAHLILGLRSVARLGRRSGDLEGARFFEEAAAQMTQQVNRQMYSEKEKFYFSLGKKADPRSVQNSGLDPALFEVASDGKVRTELGSVFMTLAAQIPSLEQAKELHQKLRSKKFWTETPIPTAATSDVGFHSKDYWRGSTWINVNAYAVRGLLGYSIKFAEAGDPKTAREFFETARQLTVKTQAATQVGFYEYYDSLGGPSSPGFSQGPRDFTWSGLSHTLPSAIHQTQALLKDRGIRVEGLPHKP